MIPQGIKTVFDLFTRFPNELSCHQYLASRRWKNGEITCARKGCGNNTVYVFKDGIRYKCKKCKYIFTAKTGTFMGSSKIDTNKWFVAIWMVLHKKGISSVLLAKSMGLTQKTGWFMLHRIRTVFGNEAKKARPKMTGIVEIDEA